MNHYSVIIIPCFFVITLVYTISTVATTTATAIATTTNIPIEQQQYLVISKNIVDKHVTEEENSKFQFNTTIQTMVQQWPDGKSDENEPITDLPIIDSPCKSSCPPNYKLCLYICE